MERVYCMIAPFGLGIAKHIKCDSVADVFPSTHAVNRFLHLAVTTVAAFHSISRLLKNSIYDTR